MKNTSDIREFEVTVIVSYTFKTREPSKEAAEFSAECNFRDGSLKFFEGPVFVEAEAQEVVS